MYLVQHFLIGPTPILALLSVRPCILAVMLTASLPVTAQSTPEGVSRPDETPAGKSSYRLFHPTPRELMREMSTDRPDQTESPYTVDAGHFQMELDFAHATFDRDRSGGGDVRTRDFSVLALNLKVGALNNMDLQFVLDTYVDSRVEDRVANTVDEASGFGDVQTRLKINLWGNDGGNTAFAIMPFVKWPFSESSLRNGKIEGGAIFILGYELPAGWGSAVMVEFDFVSDGTGGYDTEFVNSITFSHDVTEKLGGYAELFTVTEGAPGSKWQGQVDVGFTYAVNDNTQVDFGCNFGVIESAPDFNPFVGFFFRH